MQRSDQADVRAVLAAPIASLQFGGERYTVGQTDRDWLVVKTVAGASSIVFAAWKRHNGVQSAIDFAQASVDRLKREARNAHLQPCDYDTANAPDAQESAGFGSKTICGRTPTTSGGVDRFGVEMRHCAACAERVRRAGKDVA